MAFARAASGLRHLRVKLKSRAKERTFIFPTIFGFIFGLLSFALLLAALGYANNLLHFIVFFLLGIALISMPTTNLNTQKAFVNSLYQKPCFKNEPTEFEISLGNDSLRTAYDIFISFEKKKYGPTKIEPNNFSTVQIPWTPKKRGYEAIPAFSVESSFPYGFLRAWKRIRYDKNVLIFPEKIGNPQFPSSIDSGAALSNLGVFRELREFAKGDSIRRIDWRATEKHQSLLVRSFEGGKQQALEFNWEHVAHLPDLEAKLSQLCLWLDLAANSNASFSLTMEEYKSGLGSGKSHLFKTLEYLALYPRNIS